MQPFSTLTRSLFGSFFDGRRTPLVTLYDQSAGKWHRGLQRMGYPSAYRELMKAAVSDGWRPTGQGAVLDVGTGTGSLCLAFAAEVTPNVAFDLVDPSAGMLERAAANLESEGLGYQTIQTVLGGSAIQDRQYDAVLCGHVIEHCDDPLAAMEWLIARVRPGGRLILSVSKPHFCTTLVRWRWRHKAFPPEKVASMLVVAGAKTVRSIPFTSGPPSRMSQGFIVTD